MSRGSRSLALRRLHTLPVIMVIIVLSLHRLTVISLHGSDTEFMSWLGALFEHDHYLEFACHEALHARLDGQ